MKKWFLYIGLALFIGAFTGCKKETETPTGYTDTYGAFIFGELYQYPPDNYDKDYDKIRSCVRVAVSDAPTVPSVTINGDTILFEDFYDEGFVYSDFHFPLTAGTTYNLLVDYSKGTAKASVTMPGSFTITQPDTSDNWWIPVNSDLNVVWTSSQYVSYYIIDFWLNCDYYDTTGEDRDYSYYTPIFTTDTTIAISKNIFFPQDADSIYIWYGGLHVYACNGPQLKPGVDGNVTDDGFGFFRAEYRSKSIDLNLQGVKSLSEKKMRIDERSAFRKRVELLKRK